MIPVSFIGIVFKREYLIHYINTIHPHKDNDWAEDYLEGYNEFLKEINLELFEDIFIFESNIIQDCYQIKLEDNDVLIGVPITYFPENVSITRHKLELYNLLKGIDLITSETDLDAVKLISFNLTED